MEHCNYWNGEQCMQDYVMPEYLEHLGTLHVEPGDVVVIKVSQTISNVVHDKILKIGQRLFPNNKVVVLESDVDIGVMRQQK